MHRESRSPPRPSRPNTLPQEDISVEILPSKEDSLLKSSKTDGRVQTLGRENKPANKMHPYKFSPAGSPCDEIEQRNASL